MFNLDDRVFNLEIPEKDDRDYPILMTAQNFPSVYRPADIEELLNNIMVDQGKTGSCVGQALAKLLSIITYKQTGVTYKYSPYWLWVNRMLNYKNERPAGEGTNPRAQAMKAVKDGGCFDSQYVLDITKSWLYGELDDYFYNTVKPAFIDTARKHAPDKYAFPSGEDEIKQAILDNGGVQIGVAVHRSWGTIGSNGLIPLKQGDGDTSLGLHAMTVYGWDDKKEVWLGHNSWGKEWGKNGFFELPFDYPLDANTTFLDETNMHWAHKFYYFLWEKGIKIYDQRFDDSITRGEVFTLLAKVMGYDE